MKIAAISCARMDSKRFPGKCLAMLNGKPLLQYTIDFAREIDIPLYIWTRDIEIMEYVKDKCPIIYEPEELYDTKEDTTREKMAFANKIIGANYIVLLQPTQPIRNAEQVTRFIENTKRHAEGSNIYAYTCDMDTVPPKPDGIAYLYTWQYLINRSKGDAYFNPYVLCHRYEYDQYFDIDTKEDLERCEKWLQARK